MAMAEMAVWAPGKDSVDLVAGDRRTPMAAAGGGWWTCPAEAAGPAGDYAYSIDKGPARPDPRSAYQPQGVDGPSRIVDHGAFGWTDGGWRGLALPGAVLYELHVGTFSAEGTFDGAIGHLAHLTALGVDAIELMPVAEFGGDRGWGYDGVDLFAPHHAYGGPDGLKRLVDAAHAHGLGVIMDVVYNHLGPAGNYLPGFVRSRQAGGYGLAAAWADEWHHALHAVLTGERSGYYADFGPLPLLAKALSQAWVYDGAYSPHRDRRHGRPPAGLPGTAFVVA